MQFETESYFAIAPVAKDLGVEIYADSKCDYHLNYVFIKLNSIFNTFERSIPLPNVWLQKKLKLVAF